MRLLPIFLLSALFPAGVDAATYHVPADYGTIQAALDVSAAGDSVLVAPGTYSDSQIVGGSLGVVARLPDGVVLASEQGPEVTVIDLAGVPGGGGAGVYCQGHTTGATVVSGIKFLMHRPASSGVAIDGCSHVDVEGCIFQVDDPSIPDTSTYRKGVQSVLSDVHVTGCLFERCMGGAGAGISHNSGPLLVENCTFIECQNQGIRAQGGLGPGPHSLEVRDCLFQGNESVWGGGAIAAGNMVDGVIVDRCLFADQVTLASGGAISISASADLGFTSITNSVFRDIGPSGSGGGIYLTAGSSVITGNTFAFINVQSSGSAAVTLTSGQSHVFERNLIAHTSGANALRFANGSVSAGCNVFWDNPEGLGYTLGPTDRIADPLFCDEDTRDLTLHQSSPCLPANSLGCGLIGALGQGCGTVSVETQSWGKTKSAYRTGEE